MLVSKLWLLHYRFRSGGYEHFSTKLSRPINQLAPEKGPNVVVNSCQLPTLVNHIVVVAVWACYDLQNYENPA